MSTSQQDYSVSLLHHGAASSSSSHTMEWIASTTRSTSFLVYASHALVNICERTTSTATREPVWKATKILRTNSRGDDRRRVITALCCVPREYEQAASTTFICTGFSDGTVNMWTSDSACETSSFVQQQWSERVLVDPVAGVARNGGSSNTKLSRSSITALDGFVSKDGSLSLVTGTSTGATHIQTSVKDGAEADIKWTNLTNVSVNAVKFHRLTDEIAWILIGTAAPRYNKIHVYTLLTTTGETQNAGFLSGHEDWLTDFDFWDSSEQSILQRSYLASASQDCKIRLWEFTTTTEESSDSSPADNSTVNIPDDDNVGVMDDEQEQVYDEEEEGGEARLEIYLHPRDEKTTLTRVTLEALLIGHEERVTSVRWHPNPQALYNQDRILVSSSMDRTLFLWACSIASGHIWTPLTRVGSAGGILGGSVGSTLLGFVGAAVEPHSGLSMVGQAHGGAIHVWTLEPQKQTEEEDSMRAENNEAEDLALRNQWKATPCITGHFDAVTDLCWESSRGDYLLTVSKDQTCRLWAPITTTASSETWVELARPQVHGYDLTTIASVSTTQHRHFMVSGADEKEIRGFDAPLMTTKLLNRVSSGQTSSVDDENDTVNRVERAYIPSLGLSNKASAADAADEDAIGDGEEEQQFTGLKLPLERDLGSVSLWPEVRKLYGHNTEIFCLASTAGCPSWENGEIGTEAKKDVLVASATKAREAKDASIRIWNVESGKCEAVLEGGHKSTVATMEFVKRPNCIVLVSSGKDRRLCLWRRTVVGADGPQWELVWAKDSAHKRIIWSVHANVGNPPLVASGSRDGLVRIWKLNETSSELSVLHTFEGECRTGEKAEPVTAVAFASQKPSLLAVGLDSGHIELWNVSFEPKACKLLMTLPEQLCHISTVTKLAWMPTDSGNESHECRMLLASASADHGCRVFEVLPASS